MPIYLKYGEIKGLATAPAFKDFMMLNSYSFGVSRSIETTTGSVGNREKARTNVQDINCSKEMDSTSIDLFKASLAGKGVAAELHLVTDVNAEKPFAVYKLTNCLLSSYSVGGSENGRPTESFLINFTSIEYTYSDTDAANTKDSKTPRVSYDLSTNKIS